MSEWMDGYRHVNRWLTLAAKLEGLIEAHQILKGDQADEHDELLYRLAAEVSKEADDAGL
jgi:hypothetical protein